MFNIRGRITQYEKDMAAYEAKGIREGLIMFYGDSAFTRWSEKHGNHNLEDDIRMKDGSVAAVNHGLGGSNTEQLLYRYNRMVKPWKPRALVLKTYNNDRDAGYTPTEIVFLQSRILEWARRDFPGIKLYVCDAQAMMLGKDRKAAWYYHQLEYNELIEAYCAKHEDVKLVKISCIPELYENQNDIGDYSKVRTDLWIEDLVHFNSKGYEVFKNFWLRELDELL